MLDNRVPDSELDALYADHLNAMSGRVADALVACGLDGLCIFAGPERLVARDDIAYPFRIEPYFKAWVPLTRAVGSILKIVPGRRPELIYARHEDFWHEPPSDPTGFWIRHVDVQVVKTDAEARGRLADPGMRYGAIGDPGAAADLFAGIDDPSLLRRLDYFRAFKTGYETACMARASAIAATGHLAAAAAFDAGASEFELHQVFCAATGQRETELPYAAIVALDRHAAILHYQNLAATRPDGRGSFLLDAGADYSGYASDVTRSWARGADEFQDLIDSMEQLQQTLCRELRAGVDFVALHARAHELLARVLGEHRLITCSPDEALASGLTRVFLPHGLGHLLGLQVHDAGGWLIAPDGGERRPPPQDPFLRLTRVVEPGFVLTIEPGVYFIPSLLRTMAPASRRHVAWNAIERLLPYGGIRIEDNVLVEADGIRNLTREAFAAAAAEPPSSGEPMPARGRAIR